MTNDFNNMFDNEDDPFGNDDDLFRPSNSGSSSASSGSAGNPNDNNDFDFGGFDNLLPSAQAAEDLPEDLPPIGPQGPNRGFLIGVAILAMILVIALVAIVFAVLQSTANNANIEATRNAIINSNNLVQTSIAATATAKSWTATPSITPVPTDTPTFTPTNSPVPTNTFTPTASDTPVPGVTPSVTPPLTFTPQNNSDAIGTLGAQSAQLQAAQTLFALQETLNARAVPGSVATRNARSTQNYEFSAGQTAIAGRLTVIAATINAAGGNGGNSAGRGDNAASSATPTPGVVGTDINGGSSGSIVTPTPSTTVTAGTNGAAGAQATAQQTIATQTPGAPTGGSVSQAQMAARYAQFMAWNRTDSAASSVLNVRQPRAAQDVSTPTPLVLDTVPAPSAAPAAVGASGAGATSAAGLANATATAVFLNTESAQLVSAQTALAGQLTLNALGALSGTQPSVVLTENGQVALAQTAIAMQLTSNAAALAAQIAQTPMPGTGIYEDLAAGRVGPESLILFAMAAVGLVALIVAARRLRVKT